MDGKKKSRWAESDEESKKEEKERRQRKLEKKLKRDAEEQRQAQLAAARNATDDDIDRPAKRIRLGDEDQDGKLEAKQFSPPPILRFSAPTWESSRHVSVFERLNHIDEGTYGLVSRAKEAATGDIVALKKIKFEFSEKEGFPVTALREIQTLQMLRGNENIINLREVVWGDKSNDVYLVMDFVEHDLKDLQTIMTDPFTPSEIKTIMKQLVSGVGFLHNHYILHRDLKTSNILLNNRGQIKIADFGMARLNQFSDPPYPNMTKLVVTLWYRAPELLLGTSTYDTAIDMWSVGCIFGELVQNAPLLEGSNEVDQMKKIFELCGLPSSETWPEYRRLPNARALKLPTHPTEAYTRPTIRKRLPITLTDNAFILLEELLSLNPAHRPSAEEVLEHSYFTETPRPKHPGMFPTYPSKAGGEKRRRGQSPAAPKRGDKAVRFAKDLDWRGLFAGREAEVPGGGFNLRVF